MKIEKALLLLGLILALLAGIAWAIGRGDFGVEENSKPAPSPTAPKIVLSSPLPLRSPAPPVAIRSDEDITPAGFGS